MIYEQVAKSPEAQQKRSKCGDSINLEEEVLENLFQFTRHIIHGNIKSSTMAESRSLKWKMLKNKSCSCLPPDEDCLPQHCLRANYLAYLLRHPSLKHHPSPIGHGWELVGGYCRPVRHTRPALPVHLPAIWTVDLSDEDESDDHERTKVDEENEYVQARRDDSSDSDDLESSEENSDPD